MHASIAAKPQSSLSQGQLGAEVSSSVESGNIYGLNGKLKGLKLVEASKKQSEFVKRNQSADLNVPATLSRFYAPRPSASQKRVLYERRGETSKI